MKEKDAKEKLDSMLCQVFEKYGRVPIGYGNAKELVQGEVLTVFWIEEDQTRCIGYFRSRYTGNGEYDVKGDVFDEPRPTKTLPVAIYCAFQSVTRQCAVEWENRRPAHGNN